MSLVVSEGSGVFELAPSGAHPARCYRLIDLGTQQTEFNGEAKASRKILVQWELLGEEYMSDGRPFTVSKRYTASLHARSQLRKDLAAWRGKDFTPEELQGFELGKLLGASCYLSLIHTEKNGRDYCNIASIMPLPKGAQKPVGVNELLMFDLEKYDQAIMNQLSDNLQGRIMTSPEWQAINKSQSAKQSTSNNQKPAAAAAGSFDDFEDDIPF